MWVCTAVAVAWGPSAVPVWWRQGGKVATGALAIATFSRLIHVWCTATLFSCSMGHGSTRSVGSKNSTMRPPDSNPSSVQQWTPSMYRRLVQMRPPDVRLGTCRHHPPSVVCHMSPDNHPPTRHEHAVGILRSWYPRPGTASVHVVRPQPPHPHPQQATRYGNGRTSRPAEYSLAHFRPWQ